MYSMERERMKKEWRGKADLTVEKTDRHYFCPIIRANIIVIESC
jgi:hypothetical protein